MRQSKDRFRSAWVAIGVILASLSVASSAGAVSFSWSAPVPIDPGHDIYAEVSCPTESFCAAADDGGGIVTTTNPSGSWSVANVDGSTVFAGISCPSTSLCVAVDEVGNVYSSTEPAAGPVAWNSAFVDKGPVTLGEDFSEVSCPTESFCAAVDTNGNVFVSTEPTGPASAWQGARVDGTIPLVGISCPTESFCAATDQDGNVVTSTNPSGGAAAWSVTPVRPGLPFPDSAFRNIACPTASLCVTGDEAENLITSTDPTGGPSAWGIVPWGFSTVISAACPSASACVIGNDSGAILSSSNPAGGAGAWSMTQTGSTGFIRGISCPSVSFCVAVDDAGNALVGTPGQEGGGNEPSPSPEGSPSAPLPAAVSASGATQPSPAPVKPKKILRCRKGFKKQRVHGKARCLKIKHGSGRHKATSSAARASRAGDSPVPNTALSDATSSALSDECAQVALARPKVKLAFVAYPGRRPYEHSPRKPGHVQEAGIEVRYLLMPDACAEAFRRVSRTRIEKQIGTPPHWHALRPGYRWTNVSVVGNAYPYGGAGEFPVNETYPDWYYWHPGERFRALIETSLQSIQGGNVVAKADDYFALDVRAS